MKDPICNVMATRKSLYVFWKLHLVQSWSHTRLCGPCCSKWQGIASHNLPAAPFALLLQARILPVLASLISHSSSNSPILVEGAVELVTALLKPAGPAQAQQVHALLAQPVQSILLQHEDPGVLQNCSHYLRSPFFRICSQGPDSSGMQAHRAASDCMGQPHLGSASPDQPA